MPELKSLKIVSLQSENVKRLRAVHIRPDGALVVVKGENGQGKSSVLDSIAYVLGGEKLCPPQVIRRGEATAEVKVMLGEFGDLADPADAKLIVTRRWTASGSTLSVTSPEGAKYPSPQAVLDKLVGSLAFDPLAFMRQKPADQVETLRKLVGLDFTEIDAEHEELYTERAAVNRDAIAIRGSLVRMPEVDAPDEPVSVKALLEEQEKLLAQQRENEKSRRSHEAAKEAEQLARERLADARAEIARLEGLLESARTAERLASGRLGDAQEVAYKLGMAVDILGEPDLAGVRKRLADAEGVNARVRQKRERAVTVQKLAAKEAESAALSEKIKALAAKKSAALAAAQFPVKGLSFTDKVVTFDGLPLEQASTADQIRITFAVGVALNPRLKVVLIYDGSALSEKSLALLAELADAADAQVWCECATFRKGEGPPGIIIEDGAVDGALPAESLSC